MLIGFESRMKFSLVSCLLDKLSKEEMPCTESDQSSCKLGLKLFLYFQVIVLVEASSSSGGSKTNR